MNKFAILGIAAASVCMAQAAVEEQEDADAPRWYVGPGVGMMFFEGGQAQKNPLNLNVRVGYDYGEHLSFELEASDVIKAEGRKGRDAANIWGIGLDALYHFDRYEKFDPYVSLGWVYYKSDNESFSDSRHQYHTGPRAGIGAFYHLNEDWALRADARYSFALDEHWTSLWTVDAGLAYFFGGQKDDADTSAGDSAVVPDDGSKDTDGDGLTDAEEAKLGTDKFKADTDGDGLTDYEEVKVYKTDPLNSDTDFDGLSDGEEVKTYKTSPLERDTDKGGVSDGHEILTDKTNPLDPKDDLMLFEITDMLFDYDTTVIKPQYFGDLDKIARVLARNPEATVLIEGHADRRQRSSKEYNQNLSERRAQAVADYLVGKGVKKEVVEAKGYGFDKPKVQPDLVKGNPENRRVEVYIRGAGTNADKAKYDK